MTESEITVRLLWALRGNWAQLSVVCLLLYRHAAEHSVPLSWREAVRHCPWLSRMTVARALSDLADRGLLEARADPNAPSNAPRRYRVDIARLAALLAEPLPSGQVVPGLTPNPALAALGERFLPPQPREVSE